MVVSEELLCPSEDWVSAGVDGAVRLEGDGESDGDGDGKRGVEETPTVFGECIKEGEREMRGQYRRPALAVESMRGDVDEGDEGEGEVNASRTA